MSNADLSKRRVVLLRGRARARHAATPENATASAVDLAIREAAPQAVGETLDRPEARLVRHLAAVADPVAEVEVGQAERAALLDLPQDVEGAEARPFEFR